MVRNAGWKAEARLQLPRGRGSGQERRSSLPSGPKILPQQSRTSQSACRVVTSPPPPQPRCPGRCLVIGSRSRPGCRGSLAVDVGCLKLLWRNPTAQKIPGSRTTEVCGGYLLYPLLSLTHSKTPTSESYLAMVLRWLKVGPFFKNILIYLFSEKGEGKEKEGQKHHRMVTSHAPPTRDLAHNPGMSPDWESNQLFGSQASSQSTEPHQPWRHLYFKKRQEKGDEFLWVHG